MLPVVTYECRVDRLILMQADLSNSNKIVFRQAMVVLPDGESAQLDVLIEDGLVSEVASSIDFDSADTAVVEASSYWLTAGLIDQHINGGFGMAFNYATEDDMLDFLTLLPKQGVTSVLPTLITAPKLELIQQIARLENVIHQTEPSHAKPLGIHLEGPFINPKMRGAHPEADVIPFSEMILNELLSPSTKRITLAPELLDGDYSPVSRLADKGVLCSMGHTDADYATALSAIWGGVNSVTHVFNAMRPFHHRDPGGLMACLLDESTTIEVIADGAHVDKLVVQLIFRLKSIDKIIITTDSNPLSGLEDGSTVMFGGQEVRVEGNASLNQEGKLAGSHLTLADQVRNLVSWGLLSFPDAIQLATQNPATFLGVDNYLGTVESGKVADLILWDKSDFGIKQVFLSGQSILPTPVSTSL